jgi:hypothetical protein
LEWLLVNGDKDDSVGTKAIRRSLLNVGHQVLGCSKIDEDFSTKLGYHLLLLVTGVDTNDAASHSLRILARKRSETASSTDNGDPLAGLHTWLLQALVDGDTSAKDRGNGVKSTVLGDASDVSSLGNAVLLEGTVDGVTGEEGLGAQGLIWLLTEVASEAGSVDPLDTSMVANLDVSDKVALCNDYTGTLVTTDKG